MYQFDFDPQTLDKCILETEKQLRMIISECMEEHHGLRWEYDVSKGFTVTEIEDLERRRENEQKSYAQQSISNNILEFTYIHDLKNIITRNKNIFLEIFSNLEKLSFMLDMLAKFRTSIMHGREQVLEHQRYLCLGICGEIMLQINRWQDGYKRSIKEYNCEFTFYPESNNEIQNTKDYVIGEAESWYKILEKSANGKVDICKYDASQEGKRLRFNSGHMVISTPVVSQLYDGKMFWAATTKLKTLTKNSIDKVIDEGKRPYNVIQWVIVGNLNLLLIMDRAKEYSNRTPSSSSSSGFCEDGNRNYTNISYNIPEYKMRIQFTSNSSNDFANITAYCEGKRHDGFYRAHSNISPDLIMDILYNKIPSTKLKIIMEKVSSI